MKKANGKPVYYVVERFYPGIGYWPIGQVSLDKNEADFIARSWVVRDGSLATKYRVACYTRGRIYEKGKG